MFNRENWSVRPARHFVRVLRLVAVEKMVNSKETCQLLFKSQIIWPMNSSSKKPYRITLHDKSLICHLCHLSFIFLRVSVPTTSNVFYEYLSLWKTIFFGCFRELCWKPSRRISFPLLNYWYLPLVCTISPHLSCRFIGGWLTKQPRTT